MKINYQINISERFKTFAWLWPKTGTQTMSKVLDVYSFKTYEIENFCVSNKVRNGYTHDCALFKNHQDYKLMVSARNPYSRYFSLYHYDCKISKSRPSKSGFEDSLKIYLDSFNSEFCTKFSIRKPDYIVRVENMLEDYSKIDFIRESLFFQSGQLETTMRQKFNETLPYLNWKDYFDSEIAELIYFNHKDYFDLFNYDKESWIK